MDLNVKLNIHSKDEENETKGEKDPKNNSQVCPTHRITHVPCHQYLLRHRLCSQSTCTIYFEPETFTLDCSQEGIPISQAYEGSRTYLPSEATMITSGTQISISSVTPIGPATPLIGSLLAAMLLLWQVEQSHEETTNHCTLNSEAEYVAATHIAKQVLWH
jgi:hypothetical protein